MEDSKEALIDKEWLTVQNYQFKILVMIAVLAENKLAYRGKLKDMCEFLGVQSSTYNRNKIKEAIEALKNNGDILVIQEGQTWTLTLSVKAERKPKIIKIKKAWIQLIQQYKAEEGKEVSWENILKILVYLIADKHEIKTYEEIAAALNLSENTIKRGMSALMGIDFGDIIITKKLAYFKTQDNEFHVKGQKIDIGFNFS
jgi:Fic family protein